MKFVLTTHLFLPGHMGGTEVLTYSTARELIRRGHEVVVCTGEKGCVPGGGGARFDAYEHGGVRVFRYQAGARAPSAEYEDPVFGAWFAWFLQREAPDLVHCFHLGNLSATAIDACRAAGVPTVMTCTDYWLICPYCQLRLPDNTPCLGPDRDLVNCLRHAVAESQPGVVGYAFDLLPRPVVSLMARCSEAGVAARIPMVDRVQALTRRPGFLRSRMPFLDRVLAPTRLMQERLTAHGLDPRKVQRQAYGIATRPPRARVPDPAGRLRLGFIGALGEHKGVHVLIQAMRRLEGCTALELQVYGRPDFDRRYHARLTALAAGDARIRFCGTFPNAQIGEVLSAMDVLVVPSIWYENAPLVVYEAQAAGCAVVATDLGGLSEVVEHEVNGLLFPVGDADALARAIRRLEADRGLLARLSMNSRPPKSDREYVDELLAIYASVLEERGRAA